MELRITYKHDFLNYKKTDIIEYDSLEDNLIEVCRKGSLKGDFITFRHYYGIVPGEMYTNMIFPYIVHENECQWMVPYQEVSLKDFLNTVQRKPEDGILVDCTPPQGDFLNPEIWSKINNIVSELYSCLSNWDSILVFMENSLTVIGFLEICKKIVHWFLQKPVKHMPDVEIVVSFILSRNIWQAEELSKYFNINTNTAVELLNICGYVYLDEEGVYKQKTIDRWKIRTALIKNGYSFSKEHPKFYRLQNSVEKLNKLYFMLTLICKNKEVINKYRYKIQGMSIGEKGLCFYGEDERIIILKTDELLFETESNLMILYNKLEIIERELTLENKKIIREIRMA